MSIKTIVIIGGGPSGMMAAISSKIHNPNVKIILLERNNKLGIKLRLTGGGRCNVTANVSNEDVVSNTPKNGRFLYSSLSNFNPHDIIDFFEKGGCRLKTEDHERVFPRSNKSMDIINALKQTMERLNILIKLNTYVSKIDKENKIVITNKGEINYEHLIIATGGKSYPQTGSDGSGYDLIRSLGHSITDILPGEVPLVSNDKSIQTKALQGLAFNDIRIDILDNKVKKSIIHDLIFTHFGISGPAALRASFYIQEILKDKNQVLINIDFLPFTLLSELEQCNQDELENIIISMGIPKRLISYIKEEYDGDIINKIKKFPLSIYSTRGFSQAFVTNGGVSLKEINPKTMKSKLVNSISFCGEIMDISSFTGGYNITSAFATGYTAGKFALIDN